MSEPIRAEAGRAEAGRAEGGRAEGGWAEPGRAEAGAAAAAVVVADAGAVDAAGADGEIEVRRNVWRLLARELSEPSEELVAFVAARLEIRAPAGATGELTRRAIQEFAGARWAVGVRWAVGERLGPRASGRGRRRAGEHGSLPGYYLG